MLRPRLLYTGKVFLTSSVSFKSDSLVKLLEVVYAFSSLFFALSLGYLRTAVIRSFVLLVAKHVRSFVNGSLTSLNLGVLSQQGNGHQDKCVLKE